MYLLTDPFQYRRPSTNPYTANDVVEDVALGYVAYPKTLKFGGNTGKVNTFTGLNVANLVRFTLCTFLLFPADSSPQTGGVLDAKTLFQGDNFACFAFNLAQQAIPAALKGPLSELNKAIAFLDKYLSPITSKLECPELGQYDQGLFNSYPGRTYSPTGPDTNYKA